MKKSWMNIQAKGKMPPTIKLTGALDNKGPGGTFLGI